MSFNRLANSGNPYQGDAVKALCICSAGLLRSPSIAKFLTEKGYNTRCVGTSSEYALIPLDDVLLNWADEIHVVKEQHQSTLEAIDAVKAQGGVFKKDIYVYDIPDEYRTFDPTLMALIEEEFNNFD